MDAKSAVIEASRISDEGSQSFGEVVKGLMAANVERYHADLLRAEKTYFWPGGSEIVRNEPVAAEAAKEFDAAAVAAAVKAAQSGAIRYKEFCERVVRAGCVAYLVSIAGKRVIYYGRTGDLHTEWFPGAR